MERLFAETSGLMHSVHSGLASLERSTTAAAAGEAETRVTDELGRIRCNCGQLESLVSREPMARRRQSKYRLDQLVMDAQQLEGSLSKLVAKAAYRFRAEAEREELLNRRFAAPTTTSLEMEDYGLQENERLQASHAQMDNIIDQSRAVLSSLRDQAGSLKGVRRKILEVANTLGMSNTVLRLIERRTTQDKILLFGGMAVTLILMYVIYRGFKA